MACNMLHVLGAFHVFIQPMSLSLRLINLYKINKLLIKVAFMHDYQFIKTIASIYLDLIKYPREIFREKLNLCA